MARKAEKKGKAIKTEKERKGKSGRSGVTRRQVLKMGAVAGGVAVLTSNKAFRTHFPDSVLAQGGASCGQTGGHSPEHCPFKQALPIPPALDPTVLNPAPQQNANINAGEAARCPHQRWTDFPFKKQYSLSAIESSMQFHPSWKSTSIWGFNGVFPGPTILGKYNNAGIVRFFNTLNPNDPGPAIPEITVHLHNGHTPPESDGFAADYFGPGCNPAMTICPPSSGPPVGTDADSTNMENYCVQGSWKDNFYPNIYAGGDPHEAQYTYWYHDHRAMFTEFSTYNGLAGMYLLFDNVDSGNENDTSTTALRLPSGYGVHDIPLIFAERSFDDCYQLFYPSPLVGDKFVVNGAIQPFFQVNRRKYRFRMLNTGPTRTYQHQLNPSLPMLVVATDGNLLQNPIPVDPSLATAGSVDSILHSVAERYDVVIDFTGTKIGDHYYLVNIFDPVNGDPPFSGPQFVGCDSPTALPPGVNIKQVTMRFDVVNDEIDHSRVPSQLTTYPVIPPPAQTFEWDFSNSSTPGEFLINGKEFDPARVDHYVLQETAEHWIIKNTSLGGQNPIWQHPVHIHFEEFRIIQRKDIHGNIVPIPPLQTGRKDIVRVNPGEQATIAMQFRDFHGRYMIHCHNMSHEDDFMMARWDICPPGSTCPPPTP
jgi:FtsP/CotA-like multicopper oxidase with cupredoxin domain